MKAKTSLGLVMLVLAVTAGAQTNSVTTNSPSARGLRPLSLRDCLDLALRRNFDVQIARLNPPVARYDLSAAYGFEYDPVFSFGASRTFGNNPPMVDVNKVNPIDPYQLTTDTLSAGLNGRLTPGLAYNVGTFTSDFSGYTDLLEPLTGAWTILPPPYYTLNGAMYGVASNRLNHFLQSSVGVQLRQSLLKDFWIDAGRMQIQVSQKNVKISEQALLMQLMATILTVQTAYYDLIYAAENLKVMNKSLQVARGLYDQDHQKYKAVALTELGEKLAESGVRTAEANVLQAEELLELKRNTLRNLILDDLARTTPEIPQPTDSLVVVWLPPDRSASYQLAMQKRPDVLEARLALERQGIMVRYADNQRYPALDLVGGVSGSGVDDTSRSSTYSDAFSSQANYSVGVILRVPLGNIEARNKYKATQTQQAQAKLRLSQVTQNVYVQVDDSLRTLEFTYKRIEKARESRIAAELALTYENLRYAAGASTSLHVLEVERNLVSTQTAEIQAIVDYNKAQAQLAFNEGTSLEKNQIKVDFK
jgi:outer membrane protein TolC